MSVPRRSEPPRRVGTELLRYLNNINMENSQACAKAVVSITVKGPLVRGLVGPRAISREHFSTRGVDIK